MRHGSKHFNPVAVVAHYGVANISSLCIEVAKTKRIQVLSDLDKPCNFAYFPLWAFTLEFKVKERGVGIVRVSIEFHSQRYWSTCKGDEIGIAQKMKMGLFDPPKLDGACIESGQAARRRRAKTLNARKMRIGNYFVLVELC
jgi:hypothetical protein